MSAGSSETPLPRKLGIRPGARVALSRPPEGFEEALGALPERVRLMRRVPAHADDVLLFARRRADLERGLPGAGAAIRPAGGLWVAWPKRPAGATPR